MNIWTKSLFMMCSLVPADTKNPITKHVIVRLNIAIKGNSKFESLKVKKNDAIER